MSRFQSIPDPGVTQAGILACLQAMKSVVETLSNQRGPGRTPRVFLQFTPPAVAESENGDFWIKPDTKELFFYNGTWEAPT